jgi:hypothetical protein
MFTRRRTTEDIFNSEKKRIHDEIIQKKFEIKLKKQKIKESRIIETFDSENEKIDQYHYKYQRMLERYLLETDYRKGMEIGWRIYTYFHELINENLYFLVKYIERFIVLPTKYKYEYLAQLLEMRYNYEFDYEVLLRDIKHYYKKLMSYIDFLTRQGYNYKYIRKLELIEKIEEYFDLCKTYRASLPSIRSLVKSDTLHVIIRTHGGIQYHKQLKELKRVNIPDNLVVYKLMPSTYGIVHCTKELPNVRELDRVAKILQDKLTDQPIDQSQIDKTIRNVLRKTKKDMKPGHINTKKRIVQTIKREESKVKSLKESRAQSRLMGEPVKREDSEYLKDFKYYQNYVEHDEKIHINRIDKNKKMVYKEYCFGFNDAIFFERGIYLVTKKYVINLMYYLDLDLFFDYTSLQFSMDTEELLSYLSHYCNYLSFIDLTCSTQSDSNHDIRKVIKNAKIEGNSIVSISPEAQIQTQSRQQSQSRSHIQSQSRFSLFGSKGPQKISKKLSKINESKAKNRESSLNRTPPSS